MKIRKKKICKPARTKYKFNENDLMYKEMTSKLPFYMKGGTGLYLTSPTTLVVTIRGRTGRFVAGNYNPYTNKSDELVWEDVKI